MANDMDKILAKINKQFGLDSNILSKASDNMENLSIKRLKTPSSALNEALGGGIAQGKIVEIAGENSSGKSSIAYEFIGLTQKIAKENGEDCYCGIFETEGSYDAEYAQMLGVDLDQFYYWDQADVNAEQGLDILLSLIRSGKFKVLVVNSVAGLVPKVEEEAQLTDNQMALVARLLSKALRQVASAANKHKCTIVLINQLRESMSMFAGADSSGGK